MTITRLKFETETIAYTEFYLRQQIILHYNKNLNIQMYLLIL